MDVATIKGATRALGAPRDWDASKAGPCGGLPIRDDAFGGYPAMVSAWKPTEHELALLNAGGLVNLTVIAMVHPPVAISVEAGPEQRNAVMPTHPFTVKATA